MADEPGHAREGSAALTGLFVLACLYTIYLARPVLLPLTLGLVLDFLFRPAVRAMRRARIPEAVGAALVILVLCGGFVLSVYQLSGPASVWLAKAPRSLPQVEARLRKVLRPVERVSETAAQVDRITNPKDDLPEVQMKEPGWGATLFGGTQTFLETAIVVLTLLFFLLASGDLFLRRVIALVGGPKDRSRAGELALEIERQVSRYLYASTGINVVFGVVTAIAMHALGLPNAVLWGVVAGLTSFIPYLGGLIAAALIGMAGLLTFTDTTAPVVTIVLVFLILDTLKGYILYPLVMGRQFTMNTVMLFVALTFWWWAWGILGALLAVPLMAILKIFSERIDVLAPVAKLLEE